MTSARLLRTALATLAVAAPLAAQDAQDPRATELYQEMKVRDTRDLFVPPLTMRHIVQLPNHAEDPLAPGQVTAAGPVRSARVEGEAVVVRTEAFELTVRLEGEGLHVQARRADAGAALVFPALAVKEAVPRAPLALHEEPDAVVVTRAQGGGWVCRISRADGTLEVPGAAGEAPTAYRILYSARDQRVYVTSPLGPAERIYGLGMKSGSLDRRGRRFTMWNSDTFGYHDGTDPLYASIPFFLRQPGTGAAGVFVDDASDVVFDLGFTRDDQLSFSTTSAQADFHLFAAPRLAGVLAAYLDLTGRAELPPVWALGYHQSAHTYFPQQRVLDLAQAFRQRGIPCDALYLDIIHQDQYRPFTWNPAYFPDPQGMVSRLHELGFKAVTIVDPGIQASDAYSLFSEGRARGFFLRTGDGRIYLNNVWPGYSAFPDYLQPAVRAWWAEKHRVYLDQGVDAFKNDMSEPATFYKQWAMLRYDEKTVMPGPLEQGTLGSDVFSHSPEYGTLPHRAFHNAYGLFEAMATAQSQSAYDGRRPFVLMRNAFASSQRYTALWTGDISADWPALRTTVQMLQSLGLAGFPVVGADNGGFAGRTTAELFTRWTELSTFSPFFRTHYFYVDQSLDKEPWSFGPATEKVVTEYIRLRYRLLPYLYTQLEDSLRRDLPLLRPLFLVHEDDPAAAAAGDQYYLGDALLVAPVLEAGATGRFVYLPKGEWFDFWSGQPVRSAGESRFVPAPLDRIPVFVRAGAVVPTMEPVPSTAGTFPPKHVILEAYLGPAGASGTLYLDDGATEAHRQGKAADTRVRLTRAGSVLQLSLATEGDPAFAPERISLRVHGAGGAAAVRVGGRVVPLRPTGDALEAELPRP